MDLSGIKRGKSTLLKVKKKKLRNRVYTQRYNRLNKTDGSLFRSPLASAYAAAVISEVALLCGEDIGTLTTVKKGG